MNLLSFAPNTSLCYCVVDDAEVGIPFFVHGGKQKHVPLFTVTLIYTHTHAHTLFFHTFPSLSQISRSITACKTNNFIKNLVDLVFSISFAFSVLDKQEGKKLDVSGIYQWRRPVNVKKKKKKKRKEKDSLQQKREFPFHPLVLSLSFSLAPRRRPQSFVCLALVFSPSLLFSHCANLESERS